MLENFRDQIEKKAATSIRNCLINHKIELTHILAVDEFYRNHNYQHQVAQSAQKSIEPKRHEFFNIAKVISKAAIVSNVSSGVGRAVSAVSDSASMAVAADKASKLIGQFCDELGGAIKRIEANLPALSGLEKTLAANYSPVIESLADNFTGMVSGQMMRQIQSGIISPACNMLSNYTVDKIEKVLDGGGIGGVNKNPLTIREKLAAAANARAAELASKQKIGVAAGDDGFEQFMEFKGKKPNSKDMEENEEKELQPKTKDKSESTFKGGKIVFLSIPPPDSIKTIGSVKELFEALINKILTYVHF